MVISWRRAASQALLVGACSAAVTLSAAAPAESATGSPAPATARAASADGRVRVMPLGDSITMGIGSQTLDSYRVDLYNRLARQGVDIDFVGSARNGVGGDLDHEGHSGWTIAKLSAAVDGWLMTYQPDVVLLHIGTNDMRTDASARGSAERLSMLISRIHRRLPQTEIFVSKITGSKSAGMQARISAYNARIPRIVAGKGHKVHLVDQSTVDGLDIRDDLHPNDFGYRKMSWNYYRALRTVIGRPAWSTASNPYLATRAYRCLLVPTYPGGRYVAAIRCNWWQRVTVAQRVNGRTTTVYRWRRV